MAGEFEVHQSDPLVQVHVERPAHQNDELSDFAKEKLDVFQDKLSELVFKFRRDVFDRPEKPKLKDICARFEREGKEKRIFVPNVWKAHSSVDANKDVVVVTQLHEGKLPSLYRFLHQWEGGFSVALSLNTTTAHTLPDLLRTRFPEILERTNIDIHIAASEGVCC